MSDSKSRDRIASERTSNLQIKKIYDCNCEDDDNKYWKVKQKKGQLMVRTPVMHVLSDQNRTKEHIPPLCVMVRPQAHGFAMETNTVEQLV